MRIRKIRFWQVILVLGGAPLVAPETVPLRLRMLVGGVVLLSSVVGFFFFETVPTLRIRGRLLFRPRSAITYAPGTTLLAIANFLYSPKTVKLTFEVLIGDLQFEYNEALKEKRRIKAKYIRVRYFFLFLANMGLSKLWSAVSAIKQVIK
jgi:hypothetical protein